MKFVFENFNEFLTFYTTHKIFRPKGIDKEMREFEDAGNVFDLEEMIDIVSYRLEDVEDIEDQIKFICKLLEDKYIDSIKEFQKNNKIEHKNDNFKYGLIIKEIIRFLEDLYKDNIKPDNMKYKFKKGYDYQTFYNNIETIIEDKYEINLFDLCNDLFDVYTEYKNKNLTDTKKILKKFIRDYKINEDTDENYKCAVLYAEEYIKYLKSL